MTVNTTIEAGRRLILSPEAWVKLHFFHMPQETWGDIQAGHLVEIMHHVQKLLASEDSDMQIERYREDITAEMPILGRPMDGGWMTPFGLLYTIARGDQDFPLNPLSSRMPIPKNEIITDIA